MRVAEQATEACTPHHVTRVTPYFPLRRDKLIAETLMRALRMIQVHNATPIIPHGEKSIPRVVFL